MEAEGRGVLANQTPGEVRLLSWCLFLLKLNQTNKCKLLYLKTLKTLLSLFIEKLKLSLRE